MVDIDERHFSVDRSRSTASYTPVTDLDFGSLLCWATNDLGTQREPCLYSVLPAAGRPDSLGNCSIVNQTADSLHVECDPGYDGGLPQVFVMEVYDALEHRLVHNVTSPSAVFLVTDLPPDLELDLVFYSGNAKGRSRQTTLHAYTLRSAARRSVISPGMMHMTPVVGVLVGAVVTFVCVLIAILVVLKLRKPTHQIKKSHKNATTSTHTSSDSMDSLEKNPDIIPQKSDFLDSEESTFQKSKLSFYFSPECDIKAPVKPVFTKNLDYTELQVPTTAYLERSPSPVSCKQPRRVTFQCQAATLPRRLGAHPPPPRHMGPSDDSVLDLPGSLVRLRPETSSGPPLGGHSQEPRTPAQVQCLTTTHF